MNDFKKMTPHSGDSCFLLRDEMNRPGLTQLCFFCFVGNVATWNRVQSHGFTHKLDKSYFIQVEGKIKISTLFTG